MADQGGLFAKSGKDSFDIAGHKIPFAAVAGVAALIGVLLYMRSRGQSAQVGQAPAANTGVNPAINYTGGTTADYSAALANINQQLATLGQGINNPTPPKPAQTVTLGAVAGDRPSGVFSGAVAAYSSPAAWQTNPQGYTLLPFGSYQTEGPSQAGGAGGWYPIIGPGGQTLYVEGQNVNAING